MADLTFLARYPLLRRLLLPVAFVVAFVVFLLLTFPYDTLARRIEAEAQAGGTDITIGSLGPSGLGGLRARDIKVHLPQAPGGEALPDLRLDRADLNPDLLPLLLRRTSFSFLLEGYGGSARGHAALSNDPKNPGLTSLKLDARDVDLATLPLKELLGLEPAGKLTLKLDLPALIPVEAANGSLQLTLEGAGIGAGAVQGIPIPKTSLGKVEGSVAIEKGLARVEKTTARGGDIDADVDGSVHLRPLISLSQADLHVRFKPADKWLDANAMIKGAMGLIQNAKQPDGSFLFTFTGPMMRMTPRPGR